VIILDIPNMRRHRQIALLGFPGVGKSSLAHHFVYKHFNNEYDPNIKTSKTKFSFIEKLNLKYLLFKIFNINVLLQEINTIY
jgi:GTPase SAR1 family protein